MSARRLRPFHWLALVLVVPPVVKLVGMFWPGGGARPVSAEAFAAGRDLFEHQWTVNDPLTSGDGIGPVFNARSCVECHSQGGGGGGGAVANNVTVYGLTGASVVAAAKIPRIGVVHTHAIAPEFQETLHQVHPAMPAKASIPLATLVNSPRSVVPSGVTVTQRNTPALFGDGLLDAIPEDALHAEQRRNSAVGRMVGLSRAVDPAIRGRVARLADGRIGRFGWKGEFATLDEFVRAACANELGLSNPSKPQAISMARSVAASPKVDLSDAQCVLIGDYLRGLPAPIRSVPGDEHHRAQVEAGAASFEAIGCADCHTPNLGTIAGFYSNLLLHDMGTELASSTGYYGEPPAAPSEGSGTPPPVANEWRTPPLWGVADSAPYLHDGRAATLADAILAHKGESVGVIARYGELKPSEQDAIVAFLGTLRAPQPTLATTPDTRLASTASGR